MERERDGRGRHVGKVQLERIRKRLSHAHDGWFFAQIADRVAERRHTLGLSQAELASLCGTTQSAIARLESGGRPPRIDTLLRIATALDCDLVVELAPRDKGRGPGYGSRSRPEQ